MAHIRQPQFADDRWYPSTAAALTERVTSLLDASAEPESVIGLVAPHAGYFYSGAVAGAVYAAVEVPRRVVVLCPNHRGLGSRKAIMTHGFWRIPGRDIPIDTVAAESLCNLIPGLRQDALAHSQEHSLEVQLPFLQARNSEFQLVPLCLYPQRLEDCRDMGHVLARWIQTLEGDTLIVASSDMNHFESADVGNAKDQRAIEMMQALDPEGLFNTVRTLDISMCGMVPATIMLFAALELGATTGRLVRYNDSGDASGDKESVVGYAGLTFR